MVDDTSLYEECHFSKTQAARYLGISLRWFEDLLKRPNCPPGFKIGSRCLYRKSELNEWLEQFRTQREVHPDKRD